MIISAGRRNGKTLEMLKQAMKENELLGEALKNARREIAKLKREKASLKADKEEMARRDLQIAEEADKLKQKYEVECVRFKALMLNVEKTRKEIEELMPNNPYYRHYFGERIAITNVLEVFDKYLGESEKKDE